MKTFTALELSLIEEGQLQEDFNTEFARLQHELCKYMQQWGDQAKGAQAEITLKITMKCENADDGLYTVTASMSQKLPARPKLSTMAIADEGKDGQLRLFTRASGSTEGDPHQMRLTTQDGRPIDPKTGKVKNGKSA